RILHVSDGGEDGVEEAIDYVDDFIAAGLYDPDAPDAAQRLALLEYLVDIGASIPEIVQASAEGGILSMAAFRTLATGRDRFTFSETAYQAGIDESLALELWRCVGFPEPRPFERRFGPADVQMFQMFTMLASFVPHDLVLQLAR